MTIDQQVAAVQAAIERCDAAWTTFMACEDDSPEEEIAANRYEAETSSLHDLLKVSTILADHKAQGEEIARITQERDALLEALQVLFVDYAEFEGCYCGRGCPSFVSPLRKCGYCIAEKAITKAGGTFTPSEAVDAAKETKG